MKTTEELHRIRVSLILLANKLTSEGMSDIGNVLQDAYHNVSFAIDLVESEEMMKEMVEFF